VARSSARLAGKRYIAVVVLLRDFARGLPDPLPACAEPHHLLDFITARLKAQNLEFADALVTTALEHGKAFVLLDGLDEVLTTALRAFVRDAVATFVNRYPRTVTWQPAASFSYQPPTGRAPDLRLPDFPTFELAAFDEKRLTAFSARGMPSWQRWGW